MFGVEERKQQQQFIDSLKQGDRVAIKKSLRYGWGLDSAVFYDYDTVKRITPKRTKFDFEGGNSLERDEINRIYPIAEHTDQVNEIFRKRDILHKLISNITTNAQSKTHKKFDSRNFRENNLERAIEIAKELNDMLRI